MNVFTCLSFLAYYSAKIFSYVQVYACLPARATTDRPMCKFQSDCYSPNFEMSCVYPSVDNQTKLLRVIHGHKPPLLFLGHPLDLHYSGNLVLVSHFPNKDFEICEIKIMKLKFEIKIMELKFEMNIMKLKQLDINLVVSYIS